MKSSRKLQVTAAKTGSTSDWIMEILRTALITKTTCVAAHCFFCKKQTKQRFKGVLTSATAVYLNVASLLCRWYWCFSIPTVPCRWKCRTEILTKYLCCNIFRGWRCSCSSCRCQTLLWTVKHNISVFLFIYAEVIKSRKAALDKQIINNRWESAPANAAQCLRPHIKVIYGTENVMVGNLCSSPHRTESAWPGFLNVHPRGWELFLETLGIRSSSQKHTDYYFNAAVVWRSGNRLLRFVSL